MSRGNEHTIVDMTSFCWRSVNASILVPTIVFLAGSSWNPYLRKIKIIGVSFKVNNGVDTSDQWGISV